MNEEKLEYTRFPLYFDIHNWKILVVGGGTIASRRIRTLMKFGAQITVVSSSLQEDLQPYFECLDESEKRGVHEASQSSESSEADQGDKQGRYWIREHFQGEMLCSQPWNMVLACTSDAELNSSIYHSCKERGILANNASNQKECDFFFPAIVTGDGLVIGISSDGSDHGKVRKTAARIREEYGE